MIIEVQQSKRRTEAVQWWTFARDNPLLARKALTDRRWTVLQLYARDGMTLSQVAERLGVTSVRANQIIGDAINHMRWQASRRFTHVPLNRPPEWDWL